MFQIRNLAFYDSVLGQFALQFRELDGEPSPSRRMPAQVAAPPTELLAAHSGLEFLDGASAYQEGELVPDSELWLLNDFFSAASTARAPSPVTRNAWSNSTYIF